jgi:uncharacterized membrane protein
MRRPMPDRRDDIDALRGAVMILMALDHVRDFLSNATVDPTDLQHTTAALFLTRWITHYCAPTFVLLAGVSARLLRERGRPLPALSWFLLTRGLWLVVLEITVVRVGWLFQLWGPLFVGQVIWAIGWSMVVLAGLVWLPMAAVAAIAVLLMAGHNLLDGLAFAPGTPAALVWSVLHTGVPIPVGDWLFIPAYPLIPWPGVMALGYVLGGQVAAGQSGAMLRVGLLATLGFVGLRVLGVYGDPQPWVRQNDGLRAGLAFLNTTKYPPSLEYLLMTLGPAWALLPAMGRLPAGLRRWFATFGRVPLFYYVIHIYLIHALATVAVAAAGFPIGEWLVRSAPFRRPPGSGYSLVGVYLAWALVVGLLYRPCRWFAGVKAGRQRWWLSYL